MSPIDELPAALAQRTWLNIQGANVRNLKFDIEQSRARMRWSSPTENCPLMTFVFLQAKRPVRASGAGRYPSQLQRGDLALISFS